jgi:hypothetical protein
MRRELSRSEVIRRLSLVNVPVTDSVWRRRLSCLATGDAHHAQGETGTRACGCQSLGQSWRRPGKRAIDHNAVMGATANLSRCDSFAALGHGPLQSLCSGRIDLSELS